MGKLLTRDAIFSANDLTTEDVDVPEWGGAVRVKALSGMERDRWEGEILEQKGKKMTVKTHNARARLVAIACVDENGEPLFTSSDVTMLGTKSGAALDRVFAVAQRLAGIGDQDIEELSGNSEATASDVSRSA